MAFTKLDEGIVFSTIWREPDHVLRVWIAMLARKDQHGEVHASIPGLADLAKVSIEQCENALTRFKSPDKYSRTKTYGGRRIEDIPGGWFVLNHEKYKPKDGLAERREKDALRQQRLRERQKSADLEPFLDDFDNGPRHVTSRDSHAASRAVTEMPADVDVDGGVNCLTNSATPSRKPPRDTWLTPYLTVWHEFAPEVEDSAIAGQLARSIAPLVKRGKKPEKIQEQLRLYLTQVGTQYASPAAFARAFGTWTGKRQNGPAESKQERGRAAIARSLQRRAELNGESQGNREVPRVVSRALPNPRRDGRDD